LIALVGRDAVAAGAVFILNAWTLKGAWQIAWILRGVFFDVLFGCLRVRLFHVVFTDGVWLTTGVPPRAVGLGAGVFIRVRWVNSVP
jgi:hypothetical protein